MHIPEYSQIVSPLYLVTRKKNDFHWGPEQQQAFAQIKQEIAHAVALGPVRTGPEVKNVLYSAAGNNGLSWSPWQKVPGETRGRPLGFWSRSYRGSKANYTPTEKEILAAYEGLQAASEVIGTETQLLLAPRLPVLGWMFKGKVPSTHHATDTTWSKWIALITQRARIRNPNRPGILEIITNWPEGETFGLSSEEEEEEVTRAKEAPPYNELPETERQYALFTDGSCRICRGKPIWAAEIWQDIAARVEKLTVKVRHVDAHVSKSQANEEHHNNEQVDKAAKVKVSQVIHNCETCAAIKQAKRVKPLWYGGRWLKYRYGEAWQIDYITLPQTRQGKRYVLTMVEATTGWLETYPVPHATARNTILGLEKLVLWRHGTPEGIESDNGTHFKNGLINTWAREHGIEWIYHIPYHAPAAGKVEQCNGLLKTTLKALGGGTFKNWELNLAKATWMVNTRGSINRAGPAQSEPLHTVDGDKVPVVHMKGILGKTVWINPTSSKGRPIRGIVFAQGPGSTWWSIEVPRNHFDGTNYEKGSRLSEAYQRVQAGTRRRLVSALSVEFDYEVIYRIPAGVADTGSDVTIFAHSKWPQGWELVPANGVISGIGGAATSMQSKRSIVIEGPEGQIATDLLFKAKNGIPGSSVSLIYLLVVSVLLISLTLGDMGIYMTDFDR
ncbi:hypothetical protein DUI87_03348 [Hirundo rustica rustica]|uniref:Uncharacterized protein n=1 Tax=Hirundo rustica rustica TaxID=333673 RepID=A0A3M0L741_HIRRU|nr:hypothetical protein DUI87_03348 [Hirundo rustica rustica]